MCKGVIRRVYYNELYGRHLPSLPLTSALFWYYFCISICHFSCTDVAAGGWKIGLGSFEIFRGFWVMEVNDGVFFGVSVGGSDFVQLDLFDTLHLHNSTYQGITLGIGVHTLSPGVIFTGES